VSELADFLAGQDALRLPDRSRFDLDALNLLTQIREEAIDRLVCEGVEVDHITLFYDRHSNESSGLAVNTAGPGKPETWTPVFFVRREFHTEEEPEFRAWITLTTHWRYPFAHLNPPVIDDSVQNE
jgi:hypothetical protein